MCKLVIQSIICIGLLFTCKAQEPKVGEGFLSGMIGIYEGNCMPGPEVPPFVPKPISTTVYITKLSEKFQEDIMVASVKAGSDGSYSIRLKKGTYSLFLGDGEDKVCDLIQCPDKCYCRPFEIKADSTTVINANLDHAVW